MYLVVCVLTRITLHSSRMHTACLLPISAPRGRPQVYVHMISQKTRKHSSRMRTAHLLPVSPSMQCAGGCALGGWGYLLLGGCLCQGGLLIGGCLLSGVCSQGGDLRKVWVHVLSQKTRKHSSRMRTVCCSGHLPGGGCLPRGGGVCPGMSAGGVPSMH